MRLGPAATPAMVVRPGPEHAPEGTPCPVVLWMHGRTAHKELDPGRYLRWMRAGIGVCALDLPGHGERSDPALQTGEASVEVIAAMVEEIDGVLDALTELGEFDMERTAIGGMSAGGMAALARLCRPHRFRAASVEATTGSWRGLAGPRGWREELLARLDPIENLDRWREIPLLAIHARFDEWVPFADQERFIEALRARYADPSLVELLAFDRTGAPYEHIGFGRRSAEAKDAQTQFLSRWLLAA